MGPRVEQPSEFFPRASRASRRHLEDLADSLHRLPSAAEDLQVIIPRCNRALLLQGAFRITLSECTLLAGCRLKLHDQFSGYPAAIRHFNALSLGPLAYLGWVQPACRSTARATRRPPGSAAGPPGSTHVAGQGIPQLLGILGVQVDLVLRAVQAETDRSFGGTAIKVIDEQGLYLLGHDFCSVLVADPMHQHRQPEFCRRVTTSACR